MRSCWILCFLLLLVFGLGSGASCSSRVPIWQTFPRRVRRESLAKGALAVKSLHERVFGRQGLHGDTDGDPTSCSMPPSVFSRDLDEEQYEPDRGATEPHQRDTTLRSPDWCATNDKCVQGDQPVICVANLAFAVLGFRVLRIVGFWVVIACCLNPVLAATGESEHTASTPNPWPTPKFPSDLSHKFPIIAGVSPRTLAIATAAVACCALVCLMMPGIGMNAGGVRLPPAWGPEMQQQYPFRRWVQDVLLWSVASDLDASRKAAMLVMQLSGGAQELARSYPPQVLIHGGNINGQPVDPLTFVIHGLSERFAALGEELRLGSITELLSFARLPHKQERIDEILVRFDVVRQPAFDEGQLTVSITGLTWLLLRAVGISDTQLLQLLAPFGGNFPQTELELQQLKQQLRRMGHILEHAPGNVASVLRGPSSGRSYFASEEGAEHAFHAHQGTSVQDSQWSDTRWPADWGQNESWGSAGAPAYAAWPEEDSDNWTDSDTASSYGDVEAVTATPDGDTDPTAVAEHLWWAYTKAKMQWRQHVGKPPRATRRYARRYLKGKGKGKGSGRPDTRAFLADAKAKGKGFRRRKGKGKGRPNPKTKDGQVLRCFRCGSETHLSRDCHLPRTDARPTPQPAASTFLVGQGPATEMPEQGPLSGLVFMAMPYNSGAPMPDPNRPHTEQSAATSERSSQSWQFPEQSHHHEPHLPDPWADYLRSRTHANPFVQAQPSAQEPYEETSSGAFGPTQWRAGPSQPTFSVPPQPGQQSVCLRSEPASLPAFVNLPALGFLRTPPEHVNPGHVQLLPAAAGCTLDSSNACMLNRLSQANSYATSRWLGQSVGAPASSSEVTSELPAAHHGSMQAFHDAQVAHLQRRKQTDDIRNANKKNSRQLIVPTAVDAQPYEQVDSKCPLCQDVFLENDLVLRLVCRHIFHADCWSRYLMHEAAVMACPVCRGSARVISRFNYIAEDDFPDDAAARSPTEQRTPSQPRSEDHAEQGHSTPPGATTQAYNIYTPPGNNDPNVDAATEPTWWRAPRNAADATPGQFFPWWPASQTGSVFHTTASHPSFSSLLIDPGAYTNLAGINWVRKLAQTCLNYGLAPTQNRMTQPMHVQGVGSGSQQCTWAVKVPIALPSIIDGEESVTSHEFEAPVVAGDGASLPALLGLKSLRAKNAILVLSTQDEHLRLIIPGPGGVDLNLSPGSVEHPLTTAPSGHLLLRCDAYDGQRQTALGKPASTFAAIPAVLGEQPGLTPSGAASSNSEARPAPSSAATRVHAASASHSSRPTVRRRRAVQDGAESSLSKSSES